MERLVQKWEQVPRAQRRSLIFVGLIAGVDAPVLSGRSDSFVVGVIVVLAVGVAIGLVVGLAERFRTSRAR